MKKPKWIIRKNKNAAAIGIIGGADGPTAIFVGGRTKPPENPLLRFVKAVAVIAGIAAALTFGRAKRG